MAALRRLIHVVLFALCVATLLGAALAFHAWNDGRAADKPSVRMHDVAVPVTTATQREQLRRDVPAAAAEHGGADTVVAVLGEREAAPFTMLGVTWASGLTPERVYVEARWRVDGRWSSWTELDVEPDAARVGRPGTQPLWVGGAGSANAAAIRVTSTADAAPKDVKLVTINPGTGLAVQNMAAAQPAIVSRASWGAGPQASCDSPIYGTLKGAVIHHTAGSNTYTAADSPGIVRGIQAYHMDAQGWCDIGYNFLVDQFGTVFEGRAGGIDKQVRGAHSGNADVNLDMMGVSLMGEFTSTAPTAAAKDATVGLIAWRFAQAGLPAKGPVTVGGLTLERISGHRDVVNTACPGALAYSWVTGVGGVRDAVASRLATTLAAPANMHLATTTASSITWAWSPVAGVSRYEIMASSSSNFATTESRYVTGTSYTWGFGSEGTFYAKVRGVDAAGVALTGWSTAAQGSPVAPPANMIVSTTTASSITWAWSPVAGVSRYEIMASSSSNFATTESRYVTGTSYTWGFGSEGTFYAKVRGVDAAGVALTGWSTAASGSPVAPVLLPAPANMRVSATGTTSVTWAWNAVSGVSRYELMATSSPSFATTESRTVTGTAYTWGFGSDYLFYAKVRGLNSAGTAVTGWSSVAAGSPNKGDKVASVASSVRFDGHGYGHGVGMSQYGAQGAGLHGVKYGDILATYYPGTAMGTATGDISVRMMSDDSVLTVAPQSGLVFRSLATGSTRLMETTYGGRAVTQIYLRPTPGKETTSSDLVTQTSAGATVLGSYYGDAQFEASTMQLMVGSAKTTYRSVLRSVRPTGSASRYTVNVVSVENYVKGVVSKEMPSSWSTEALRAQAVAARTYGVYDRTSGDKYYNTCDTTSCQVYGGVSAETSSGNAAVDATAGQIRTYGGATAFTQFSSSSGGFTNRGSQPYLSPVDDSLWESWSANPNHNWSSTVSVATIESKLGISDLVSITISARNGFGDYGGRSVTVVFGRQGGATIVKSGDEVRSMFGLKSNWFRVF